MDGSFLSDPAVIAASRRFVCVRLMTYEDEAEGKFLKSLVPTRSGELENTVFAVLTPDGKRPLARPARSARQTFGDAARMAEAMNRIASDYPPKEGSVATPPVLPAVRSVRLAVNVAACDGLPLAVVFAEDAAARRTLEGRLASLARTEAFLGRFVYAVSSGAKDFAGIEGPKPRPGVLVIQPDRFGQKGKLLKQVGFDASREEMAKLLREAEALHQREAAPFGLHVREGRKQGVFWETALPVTDPMELRARERKFGP